MTTNRLDITDPDVQEQIRRTYFEGRSDPDWTFEYVTCELFDEWKWGVIRLLVLREGGRGELWGLLVRETNSGGDHWTSFEDGDYDLEEVVAVPKIEYVLARMVKP